MNSVRQWWKEAVIYQIYPRSFFDSDGDGIGDLRGILAKLDYLQELGIDAVWLCPVYQSPNDDNGYDISDYCRIAEEFGNMADWEELLAEMHRRGLKLIMDLVVNHTSDEHPWFVEARASRNSTKRDYYIWREGKDGKEPNNWQSFFTPSAWEYDGNTGEYYLHLFSVKQPDLNWENPVLRGEIYDMMRFWLDKGIDGFRMDVINCISKTEGLPDVPGTEEGYRWGGDYFMNGPRIHEYLREMNELVLSWYDIMTVGETPCVTPETGILYVGDERRELNMLFQFELMDIDSGPGGKWDIQPWRLTDLKRIVGKWQLAMRDNGWNSLYMNNHDQPRMVSRFGNDGEYRAESAKMLATLLHTLRGTPFIYQGEEIGMRNVSFGSIEEYRDIETLNLYREKALQGNADPSEVLALIHKKGRDNARTPMQWDDGINAGFSGGMPWIGVNPDYTGINVQNALADGDSILHYYKKLIAMRKENPVMVYGEYIPILEDEEAIFAYIRQLDGERLLVILNFTGVPAVCNLAGQFSPSGVELLLSNYPAAVGHHLANLELRPFEARVYRIV